MDWRAAVIAQLERLEAVLGSAGVDGMHDVGELARLLGLVATGAGDQGVAARAMSLVQVAEQRGRELRATQPRSRWARRR